MVNILTVTLNPSVDLSTHTAQVVPGPKLRCEDLITDPGGGGINVARAIRILGGSATAFVAAGGTAGGLLIELLMREGIPVAIFPAPGETRESLAVTERATGRQFRFVFPGPDWPARTATRALGQIAALAGAARGYVVLSGSQPPGVGPDFPLRLARKMRNSHGRVILDTSGKPLWHTVEAGATGLCVLRMDQEEAEEIAGRPLPARGDSADFAQGLAQRGAAKIVIVARGADGSVLATASERLHAVSPRVAVKSKVGAGDSFVGAFTLALSRNEPLAEALRRGTAAATAAVMTEATQLCTAADARRIARKTVVAPV